jgi:alpha-glucosidase
MLTIIRWGLGAVLVISALGATEVKSPDGHLAVDVRVNQAGEAVYELRRDGVPVLGESRLGLVRDDADFSRGLSELGESRTEKVKDRYELLTAKRWVNTYRANKKVVRLAAAGGRRMDVVFQVSNDGAAFRYVFPDADATPHTVTEEATSFRFPAEAKAWLQPMSVAKSGWAKTNPSYEEYHEREIAVGTPSTLGAGWVFPALFRTGETWVLISEAALGRGYCASRLRHESAGGEYRIGFPDARETIGDEAVNPRFTTPYATPWRVIAAGDLKTVAESALGTDLAAPAIKTAKLAGAPGKASWSWPKLGDKKTVYEVQKRFIDYAAEMGWAYCLIDALWDKQITEAQMAELVGYAQAKKVGVLLWYNSNGNWNDAFQTPKNRMVKPEDRRAEFARLHALGVQGVKIDFFGGDGRAFVELYQDILDDAAKEGLLVNFHGATLPRGWARTYPNLMTAEAVRGYEFITFEQGNADRAPAHMAMLPFTRNVFDPMDFTPLCLEGPGKVKRRTTVAAELATAVLFTSGIQHYVEIPEVMAKQPDYVRAALKDLPTVWEESRFLAGYPGKLAVFARRGADGRWWVAGFNGETAAKMIEVSLAGLGKGKAGAVTVITDGESGGFARSDSKLEGKKRTLRLELKPCGGFLTSVE